MDAIVVDRVTKTYRIGVGRARIREMLPWPLDWAIRRVFPRWWIRDTFNALENVSFSIPAGNALGLIGHNGAGKTTMLKVISRVTAPTEGQVMTSGRVAALIDVLVGFHPDLTGRENTYLLGAIYGFGRKEMGARIERILEFAEIEELADTPLKRYSTGMMARLGFAIIASLDMDVLLVDEVLTVGDASFQKKCIRWLKDFREAGGTLVFVSHNLALMRSMTDRVVWLDHGKLIDDGPTDQILARYARAMETRESETPSRRGKARKEMAARGLHRWGSGGAQVEHVHVRESNHGVSAWKIEIAYRAMDIEQGVFCIGFTDEGGRELGGAISSPVRLERREGKIECLVSPIPFHEGIYFPVVALLSPDGTVCDRWRLDRALVVDGNGKQETMAIEFGPVDIPARWMTD